MTALASLTATYTDSEGEDNADNGIGEAFSPPKASTSVFPRYSPEPIVRPSKPSRVQKKAKTRLVSYHDDTLASEDEDEIDQISEEEEIIIEVEETEEKEEVLEVDRKYEKRGIKLPPEPTGRCSPELQKKINTLYGKMVDGNLDMNDVIQKRKDFRNPSIYEKLIQFCDINEMGTNYPPEVYDPVRFGKESFYEEIAKVQKLEMDKREKERKEKTKSELAANALKRAEEEENKKRKSKWDQPGPNVSSIANIKPAGLIQPSLTKSATGTKGTVISAFGILPKKR